MKTIKQFQMVKFKKTIKMIIFNKKFQSYINKIFKKIKKIKEYRNKKNKKNQRNKNKN